MWFDVFLEPSHADESPRVMAAEDKSVFCEEWAKDVPADPMECPWFCGNYNFEGQFSVLRAQPALAAEASAVSLADPSPVIPSLFWSWGFILWSPPLSPEGTSGEQIQSSLAEQQALQLASAIHQPHFCLLRVCIFFSLNAQRSWSDRGASPEQRAALPGNLWHLQFCRGEVLRTDLAARKSLIPFFATPCRQSETPFDWDAPWKSFIRNDWKWCAPQADFLLPSWRLPGELTRVSC